MALTTKLKVDHYAINISDEKLRYLDLTNEYLLVGEKFTPYVNEGFSNNEYAMIVDNRGLVVNCSLPERTDPEYFAYGALIKGDIRVLGNIHVDGYVGSAASNTIVGGSSNFWKYSDANNIYYDGSVTVGTVTRSTSNNYAMQLAVPAYRNIERSQLAINNNSAQVLFRCGILGTAESSPVVFNTSVRTPIEFHVNRNKDYFDEMYTRCNVNQYYQQVIEPSEIPDYRTQGTYPNLVIDQLGKVGINTSCNVPLTFTDRIRSQTNPSGFINPTFTQPAEMHVHGTLYATNILMHDADYNGPRNLDDIFVRQFGETIQACNVIPGTFGQGDFTFPFNVGIGTTVDPSYNLYVNGPSKFTCNVELDGDLVVDNIHVHNSGSFSNNIEIQNNIYFKGNLFKQMLNSNTGCNEWSMIQFDHTFFQTPAMSNIFYIGDGIATAGKFGAGIDVVRDEVNHQVSINKRDATYFELELLDKSIFGLNRALYIGHPSVANNRNYDGSTIFLTPGSQDPNYNRAGRPFAPQNMYFYPGWSQYLSQFQLNDSNIPTLGLFYNHRVGINTFSPTHDLDVHGDLAVSGDYYIKYPNEVNPVKLGVWRKTTYSSIIGDNSNVYGGIQYYDPSAPHVGINTSASLEYSLSVGGKIVSYDGYYTDGGYKMMPVYNGYQLLSLPTASIPYDYGYFNGKFGVGVMIPENTLHLRDTGTDTSLKLSQSTATTSTILQYLGNQNNFMLRMEDSQNTFELFNGPSNSSAYNTNVNRPWLVYRKPDQQYQMVLNSNLNFAQQNPAYNLLVNGSMRVIGDVDISGNYKVSGSTIFIAGSQAQFAFDSNINPENIYIAGNDIFMNTATTRGLLIGYNNTNIPAEAQLLTPNTDKSAMYVRQTNNVAHYTMKYTTESTYCLTQHKNSVGVQNVTGVTPQNVYYIGKDIATPYITATELLSGATTIGIGTAGSALNTRAHVFSSVDTQSLLHLTHQTNNPDSPNYVSDITLEKLVSATTAYRWKMQGPNSAYQQKLQFLYSDATSNVEVLTLTKDGCVGIGNTQPTFAIDIQTTGDKGSIRMYHSDSNIAKPQLLFQSGHPTYGLDEAIDYRMYSYQNSFYLDMQQLSSGQQTLFHFNSNISLGILQNADPAYDVTIGGSLNITDTLYLNGRSLFTVGDDLLNQGLLITSSNIFLVPNAANYGGVVINGYSPTSNIFQINNGLNGNLLVLDSEYTKSYMHFKNKQSGNHRIWRVGASLDKFIMEHYENAPAFGTIDDSSANYIRASEWYPIGTSNYKQVIFGSLELDHAQPEFIMNNLRFGSDSNLVSYILSSNLSIGTQVPNGQLHISASSSQPTLVISQYTSNDLFQAVNINSNIATVINYLGNVGIGTTIAHNILSVYNGNPYIHENVIINSNILLTRELQINNSGLILGHESSKSYMTTNQIGIGTQQPVAKLDLYNTYEFPALNISQFTSNNIFQASNINSNIAFVIDCFGNVGIGTTVAINKGLYVTGNTQIDGTLDVYGKTTIYGQFLNPSDARIKTDIQPITNALDIVKQINGYSFTKLHNSQKELGVIAQELQKVLPNLVHEDDKGYLSVSYMNLIALLIEAIKELDAKIELKR